MTDEHSDTPLIITRAARWIVSDDTGISSNTIWAVMMGAVKNDAPWHQFDLPYDSDDFGRCYRLLNLIPEWRARLGEVSARFPIWGPMVAAWDELTALYEADRKHEASDRIHLLVEEGRIAAGWVKTGPGSWRSPTHSAFSFGVSS